jgi:hypothetical protein
MLLYRNKEKPWEHICLRKSEYLKHFFFKVKATPNNKFMTPPRFHAMINLFFISFWRDNSNVCLGVGLGKKQWQIVFHDII